MRTKTWRWLLEKKVVAEALYGETSGIELIAPPGFAFDGETHYDNVYAASPQMDAYVRSAVASLRPCRLGALCNSCATRAQYHARDLDAMRTHIQRLEARSVRMVGRKKA